LSVKQINYQFSVTGGSKPSVVKHIVNVHSRNLY